MSERAALQQKVAALEATTQNAAEQASHMKAVQENGAQLQATVQKQQQDLQVRPVGGGGGGGGGRELRQRREWRDGPIWVIAEGT